MFQERFRLFWTQIGGVDGQEIWANQIRTAYSEPHRHYHTNLEELLAFTDQLSACFVDQLRVLGAIFFHDIIYSTRDAYPDNERMSALRWLEFAKQVVGDRAQQRFSAADVAMVYQMILDTKTHKLTTSRTLSLPPSFGQTPVVLTDPQWAAYQADGALFLDMDMAILGSSPERYAAYVGQIEAEFGHMTREAFNRGRAEALRQWRQYDEGSATPGLIPPFFQESPQGPRERRLFLSDRFFATHEAPAHRNIARELETRDRAVTPQP
ncbi:hypothetical protein PAPYR_1485 [Paratrimastix pyriformis]|uniref:Metal-dependent HD superfamily phosphohydrolase n=1 Tax=Paratrimastix pyriformis TaxID=342808 RepID=A0ABQ8UUR9_9EUKA|nr:hypothetical protein PAPYR_1485 [Paratrimastix pyriformis]